LYLRAQPLDSDEDSDSDSYDPMDYDAELFFWMLWRLLLGIVRMIPYNHLKQELLVIFLKTLHGKKVGIVTIWLVRISYFLPHTGSYLPTIFKANSDFVLGRKASMGRPPSTSPVFERGMASYVSSSHN
jgi:hypothetical protein